MVKINSKRVVASTLILSIMSFGVLAAPYQPVTKTINGLEVVSAKPIAKVGNRYELFGVEHTPMEYQEYDVVGIASWYGEKFHGKLTSNGEIFDMDQLTAAHPTLPMPSFVEVTNIDTGKRIIVRVNDRGPFSGGRQIDLSKRSAELLGFKDQGTANVRIKLLKDISQQAAQELNQANLEKAQVLKGENKATPMLVSADNLEDEANQMVSNSLSVIPAVNETPIKDELVTENISNDVLPEVNDKNIVDMAEANQDKAVKVALIEPSEVKKYIPRGVFVQIGAFSENNNNIKDHVASLSDVGVVSLQKVDISGKDLLRLRVGPYGSIDDAIRIKNQLVKLGYATSRVVIEQ